MGVEITNIEYVTASKKRTNSFFKEKFPDYNYDKFEKTVGIKKRFVCNKNEDTLSLAEKSANKLFQKSKFDREEIDFLIMCTQSPTYLIPTNSCILQDRLGLRKTIGSFDYNLGCSGYIYGLSMAKALIETEQVKNVLLITSETYNKYINENDLINQLIFSDSSSATLVQKSSNNCIDKFVFGTDGHDYDKLIVKNNFFNKEINPEEKYHSKNRYTNNNLFMDGPKIFSFTINKIPSLLEEIVKLNNTTLEKIDLFVLHQANKFLLNSIRKLSSISEEKFLIDLENIGNTVSSSIPIALKNFKNEQDKTLEIILCGFGVGLSWAGCKIKLNKKL